MIINGGALLGSGAGLILWSRNRCVGEQLHGRVDRRIVQLERGHTARRSDLIETGSTLLKSVHPYTLGLSHVVELEMLISALSCVEGADTELVNDGCS